MNAFDQINTELSAALAMDLASDMRTEAEVFAIHSIDPIQGGKILKLPWFRSMVDQAKKDWESVGNARQRIKLKAQIALEESISDVYKIVTDTATPAAARVSAFKELKDLSGAAVATSDLGLGTSGPQVNIFLGGAGAAAISINSHGMLPETVDVPSADIIDVTPSYQETGGAVFGMLDD